MATRSVPRSNYFLDMLLDFLRRDPSRSADVLQGLLLGRTAPIPRSACEIENPALVIGHPADPLHPFSDADMVAHEMPNARLVDANSILEWRISPARLDDELAAFLDEVWDAPKPSKRRASSKPKAKAKAKSRSNSKPKPKSRSSSKAPKSGSNSKPKSSAKPRRKSGSTSR